MEIRAYSSVMCTQVGFRHLLRVDYRLTTHGEHLERIRVYGASKGYILFAVSYSISYVKSRLEFHCKVSSIERLTEDALTASHNENATSLNMLDEPRVALKT